TLTLVPNHRHLRIQCRESTQPVATQDLANGRAWQTHLLRDRPSHQALVPQGEHSRDDLIGRAMRDRSRSRAAINQSGLALGSETLDPLASGLAAQAYGLRRKADLLALLQHSANKQPTGVRRTAGVSMEPHSGFLRHGLSQQLPMFPEDSGWYQPTWPS